MTNPKVCLRVGHQHSQFWPILARFVDYYSLFWGPGVISTIHEPQGALTCRSSTLAVLADSGLFHGLLLTVLGSESDFNGCRTPKCAYVLVINTRSFGRFWPVSWTITHRFGVNPGCVYVSVINTCSFCRFCPVSGLLRTVLEFEVISTINEPQDAFTCRSSIVAVVF